jgi:hypothetical protein
MRMKQKFAPVKRAHTIVMNDGQLRVDDDDILEIPRGKEHWFDYLWTQGYRPLSPELPVEEQEEDVKVEPSSEPKRGRGRPRKGTQDGT